MLLPYGFFPTCYCGKCPRAEWTQDAARFGTCPTLPSHEDVARIIIDNTAEANAPPHSMYDLRYRAIHLCIRQGITGSPYIDVSTSFEMFGGVISRFFFDPELIKATGPPQPHITYLYTLRINGIAQHTGVLDLVSTLIEVCLLYTSPSPRDLSTSRMPSSA